MLDLWLNWPCANQLALDRYAAMINAIRAHKKLTVAISFALLPLAWWGWDCSAYGRGHLVARYDVAQGHCQVLGYGLPPRGLPEFARLMKERYGIEYHAVAGCIVSRSQRAYVDGYDEASMSAAKRKFGRDVFRECWQDAGQKQQSRIAITATAH